MEKETVWISFEVIKRFMRDVFTHIGVPGEDAETCADVLAAADKKGFDSHGIARLKSVYYDRIREGIQSPTTRFEVVCEGPTTAVIDGHDGMGQVIAKKSMEMAISKAKKYGMGMVAVRNSTHYGIAGYYVEMACKAGMIGITGTNASPTVAPTFGVENILGTNPFTSGLPTDEKFPFIIDCATSTTQKGKIEVFARQERKLPGALVIDRKGNHLTDARGILEKLLKGSAALTPLGGVGEDTGGHKGYGYATLVEILSAALQGGPFLKMKTGFKNGKRAPYHLGHFFIAIDISSFVPLKEFQKTAGLILRALRSSKKMPGQSRIYTAGEKEYLTSLERKNRGIPVNKKTLDEMLLLRDELKLKLDLPLY